MDKVLFSKNTDDWKTPSIIYNAFISHGWVDCFPFHCEYNELDRLYVDQKLFINPPYSKLKDILWWLLDQISYNRVMLLIPCRSDTEYWSTLMLFNPRVYFIKGRLHFNDSKNVAPFPSVLLDFNHYRKNTYNVISQDHIGDLL